MAEVSFHLHVGDRLDYARRLLHKAVRQEKTVWVRGDAQTLDELDASLWSQGAFLPHCRGGAPYGVLARTPIVLDPAAPPWSEDVAAQAFLLNLGADVAQEFPRYARVIEIVGQDEEDKRQARRRWKHYAAAGVVPTTHQQGDA
ncbi:DNA polymerase III subunit chi [Candidatus Symbiobacter mobilis]|uniref:DNA polymerase III subunit chi n=1 Tax=Candidatus Symbiobacter mobilis CR TaxID=946483 RepID=U5N9L3_9BURK|nr:DNA polymerase III subunit chi [Candidatus Symbiobacter mobilis]AGX88097.1 DNA polymerase III subunit chi [Candidatus Symbiobacter mobilis CR]